MFKKYGKIGKSGKGTDWKKIFEASNVTGQHDRQDKRLTSQLPNQFRHCMLTGRYFEPCFHSMNTATIHFPGTLVGDKVYITQKGVKVYVFLSLNVLRSVPLSS